MAESPVLSLLILSILVKQLNTVHLGLSLDKNGTCPEPLQALNRNVSNECIYELSNDTVDLISTLKNSIVWEDGTSQHINLQIKLSGNDTENDDKDIIHPEQWLLTYIDQNGPYYYVSWRSDFKILSIGLLNDYKNKPINIIISEMSGNCDILFGSDETTREIVVLLLTFIKNVVKLDNEDSYKNINLCYWSKFRWFDDSSWYRLKQYLGIPFQEFGYKCCMMTGDTVCCDDKLHTIEGYRLLPYILSVLIVCYFPLGIFWILNRFSYNSYLCNIPERDGDFISVHYRTPILLGMTDTQNLNLSEELVDQDVQTEAKQAKENESSTGDEKPKTCCEHIKIRYKRLLFWCLTPLLIFIELIVFAAVPGWRKELKEIDNHKLLFGFTSILGDTFANKFVFPVGPFFVLLAYGILGFGILVLPEDFEKKVCFSKDNPVLKNIIDNVLNSKFPEKGGYKSMETVMRTLMVLPLYPAFWVQEKRKYILCFIIFIIYPICFALPIASFVICAVSGYGTFIFVKLFKKSDTHRQTSYGVKTTKQNGPEQSVDMESNILEGIQGNIQNTSAASVKKKQITMLNLFFGHPRNLLILLNKAIFLGKTIAFALMLLLIIIFLYLYILIVSYSIYLVVYVFYFTALAFIVLPNETAKYIILVVWGLIFLVQVIRDSTNFYRKLFQMTIQVCDNHSNLKKKYITNKEYNVIFIKKNVVLYVFRQVRPVFIQIGQIFIKITLVFLLYISSVLFLNNYSNHLVDIIEHITILITSVIPILIEYKFKDHPDKRVVELLVYRFHEHHEQASYNVDQYGIYTYNRYSTISNKHELRKF